MQPFEPSLYGDRIADVYDDLYGDATDVEGTVRAVAALAAGGPVLELVRRHGGWHDEPFDDDSDRQVVVYRAGAR